MRLLVATEAPAERSAEPAEAPATDMVRSAAPSPAGPIDAVALRGLPLPPEVGLPAAAQVLWFSLRQSGFVFRQRSRLGDVWSARGYVRGKPVVVCHPDHVRSLFSAPPELVPTLAAESPLGPGSVLTANEPRHLPRRKLLLPAFHGEAIAAYEAMIARAAEREISRWPLDRPFALAPRMQAATARMMNFEPRTLGLLLLGRARDEAGEVLPTRMRGRRGQRALDRAQDDAELAVIDADHDRQSGVPLPALRPAPGDAREVLDVEGDHDPALAARQSQQILVGPAVQLALLVRGKDVVAGLAQRARDSRPRDVGVEEKAHRALLPRRWVDAYERVLRPQLKERPTVQRDRLVDLVRKALVIMEGEPDRPLADGAFGGHRLDRPQVAMGLDDLPNVECRADHPGATVEVIAAEGYAGEQSRPQRLFGERLDDGALAALRALRLGGDQRLRLGRDTDAERFGFGRHGRIVTEWLRCNTGGRVAPRRRSE
jgi:hypothetical protein